MCYIESMNEEIKQKFEQDLLIFANKYSLTRLKVSTPNFDREYRRGADGQFLLKSQKAIIRSYGRMTKVAIGEGEKFSTFEEAEKAVKKHWSEYYKKTRANRTPAEKAKEARRQRRYREKYKNQGIELKRQQ